MCDQLRVVQVVWRRGREEGERGSIISTPTSHVSQHSVNNSGNPPLQNFINSVASCLPSHRLSVFASQCPFFFKVLSLFSLLLLIAFTIVNIFLNVVTLLLVFFINVFAKNYCFIQLKFLYLQQCTFSTACLVLLTFVISKLSHIRIGRLPDQSRYGRLYCSIIKLIEQQPNNLASVSQKALE